MDIPERNVGDVSVVALSGRLDTYSSSEVEQKFNSLIDTGRTRLVVNFKDLAYISSSGLRVLLAALKKVRKQQGDVKLAAMQPNIKEVFDMAGFTQLFSLFETEEAAIAAFQGAGQ